MGDITYAKELKLALEALGEDKSWPIICSVFGHNFPYEYNSNGPDGYGPCERCDKNQHEYCSETYEVLEHANIKYYFECASLTGCQCRYIQNVKRMEADSLKYKQAREQKTAEFNAFVDTLTEDQKLVYEKLNKRFR